MKCPRCHEVLNEGSGSCPSCGYTIEGESKKTAGKGSKIILPLIILGMFLAILAVDKLVLSGGSKAKSLDMQNKSNFKAAMDTLSREKVSNNMTDYLETLPSPEFTSVTASSSLSSSGGNSYKPENAYDEDLYTCWSEGVSGLGKGEWIRLSSKEGQYVKGLLIANGYQKSDKIFSENSLVKKVKIEFSDGTSEEYDLLGSATPKRETVNIELKNPKYTKYIKITILEGQEGADDGKSDVCISNIKIY